MMGAGTAPLVMTLCIAVGISACGHLPKIRVLHDPLSAREHLELGMAYEREGRLGQAISEYRVALKRDDPSLGILPLIFLGNAYAQQQQYPKAEGFYRKALKVQPDHGEILNNLAWVYLKQETRLLEAEDLVRRALALDPPAGRTPSPLIRAGYLDTLAEALIAQVRHSEAVSVLKEAGALIAQEHPTLQRQVLLKQARALEALGQVKEAEEIREMLREFADPLGLSLQGAGQGAGVTGR